MVGEEGFEPSNHAFEACTVTDYIIPRWSRRRESNPELSDLKSDAAANWATTGNLDLPAGIEPATSVLQTDPITTRARQDFGGANGSRTRLSRLKI
jgi:hypothetical protein